jgi:hypothetical protein
MLSTLSFGVFGSVLSLSMLLLLTIVLQKVSESNIGSQNIRDLCYHTTDTIMFIAKYYFTLIFILIGVILLLAFRETITFEYLINANSTCAILTLASTIYLSLHTKKLRSVFDSSDINETVKTLDIVDLWRNRTWNLLVIHLTLIVMLIFKAYRMQDILTDLVLYQFFTNMESSFLILSSIFSFLHSEYKIYNKFVKNTENININIEHICRDCAFAFFVNAIILITINVLSKTLFF